MIGKTKKFIGETVAELHKATWPWNSKEKGFRKYKELVDSTIVVVIASILLAGYVGFVDFIMVNIVGFLTSL